MSGLRFAPASLRSVAAALCVAPLLAVAATPEKVEVALDAFEPNVSQQNEQSLSTRVMEIEAVLELSEERAKGLHEIQAKALAESLVAWRRTAGKELSQPSIQDQHVEQGLFGVTERKEDQPEAQPAWKEGLRKILTPAELQRLEERRAERKERRTRNLAALFVLFVDEKLALSAQQREQLLPIAVKLVPKMQEMMPEDVEQDEDLMNPAMLLSAGKEAPEKEVRAILTAAQWVRWKKACVEPSDQSGQIPGLVDPQVAVASAPVAQPPAAPVDREPVDQMLSKFMAAQAALQRQRLLAPLLLQLEEAARVAGLSPEVYARLQVGARGSAERSLAQWSPQFQYFVRNNLREVTPENVSQQLARLGNPMAFQPAQRGAAKPGIFEKALAAELTPGQMAAWQKEIEARRDYRSQTIIHSMLITFDRLVPLRNDQFSEVATMLAALLFDFREEMEKANPAEPTAWYLQSDVRSAPLAGLDPATMETLLGKTRWERWTKTEEYSDARSCWNNLKEMRQNRRR